MALTKIDDRGLNTPIDLLDNEKIRFGTGNDLEIYHDGSHSWVNNSTGNLYLRGSEVVVAGNTTGETIAHFVENGAAILRYDNSVKLETTSTGVSFNDTNITNVGSIALDSIKGDGDDNTNITFGGSDVISFKCGTTSPALTVNTTQVKVEDDQKFVAGTGNDLQIYHSGSETMIDNTTGTLYIRNQGGQTLLRSATQIFLSNWAGNEHYLKAFENSAVELYYDNVKKASTDTTGFVTHGGLTVHGEINIDNGGDNDKYLDARLGSTSFTIRGTSGGDTGHETLAQFTRNGAVNLYYDNSKKLETTSVGTTTTGNHFATKFSSVNTSSPQAEFNSDVSSNIAGLLLRRTSETDGDYGGLEFHNHPSSNTAYRKGAIYFESDGNGNGRGEMLLCNDIAADSSNVGVGDVKLKLASSGAVELYHGSSKKVETTSDGILISGVEGGQAALTFEADEGDDHSDVWQLYADDGNLFRLQHKDGNVWQSAVDFYSEDHLSRPVLRGPGGGINFSVGVTNMNGDMWNDYSGDGHLHRTDGQAYIAADDYLRFRKNGAAENKRFEFRTDTGNAGAQNDWQDDQFDFAEMFEWSDGNPSNQDRVGNTVAVDGLTGKIKIAESGDTVIGVVSGTAAFTANCASMQWQGAYLRDEWGRLEIELVKDADGNQLYNDPDNGNVRPKVNLKPNPDWDENQSYHRREDRKEWDKIGIIGQCYVRKTAVIPSSWIKLKEIDSVKDFYLIK